MGKMPAKYNLKELIQNWPQLLFRASISIILLLSVYWLLKNQLGMETEVVFSLLLGAQTLYIIPFVLLVGFSLLTLGLRFYYLIGTQISLKEALRITCIGSGANMILPARGGDVLRIAWIKKVANQRKGVSFSYLNVTFLILFERFLDFFFALSAGCLALLFMQTGMTSSASSPLPPPYGCKRFFLH